MNRVVFDTNTLVSSALKENSTSRKAFQKAVETSVFLASDETLKEFDEVIFRSKFDKYISLAKRQAFFDYYISLVNIFSVELKLTDCRDPKDNKYLELAVTGSAEIIVTGDNDLLVLHPFREILIVNSTTFLE